jgi:hypothetical protein
MPKNFNQAMAYSLMCAMFHAEGEFIEPSPQAIEKVTLPIVKEAVMQQLVPFIMEVCLVSWSC